jgi:hypothetical protein
MIDSAILERENMRAALEQNRDNDLRLLPELPLSVPPATTPHIFATAHDAREVVRFLNKRPQGVTIIEAVNADQRRLFEPRKISAYEFWGIIHRTGERLRLSPLGLELARKLEPETRVYRRILRGTEPYRSVLEWLSQQGLQLVTHMDVAAYWQDYYAETLGRDDDDKSLEGHVVCFFHLCQAAGLGTVTLGKRGQLTRLRIEREELEDYLIAPAREDSQEPAMEDVRSEPYQQSSPEKLRVYVSTGGKMRLVPQLRAAFDLAEMECRVVERERVEDAPLPADVFQAMRECDAALMVLNDEDFKCDECGRMLPLESLLLEIGAAFALYGRRVVLLQAGQLPVPANLLGLRCDRFGGSELTWDEGVRLVKTFKDFKRDERQAKVDQY